MTQPQSRLRPTLEIAVALFALAVLVACSFKAVLWVGRPFPGFLWAEKLTVNQLAMPDHWQGKQLGLQADELLLSVDGQQVIDSRDFRERLATFKPGETHVFQFEGRPPLSIPITRFGWGDFLATAASPLGMGFVYLLLGAGVRLARPRHRDAAIFYYFGMVGAFYNATLFDNATDHAFRTIWILALTQVPASMLPMAVLFRSGPLPAFQRIGLIGFAGFCAILGTAYALAGNSLELLITLWHVIMGVILVGYGGGFAGLLLTRFRATELLARRQADLVMLGWVLSTSPSAIWTGINLLGFEPYSYQLASVCYVFFPGVVGYAILKHRLFDLNLVLRRSLTYTLVTGVLGGAYLVGSLAVGLIVQKPALWVQLLLTAAIAVSYAPLRDAIKHRLDRHFFRTPYDFQAIVGRFAALTRRTLDVAAVSKAFHDELDEALHPESIQIARGAAFDTEPAGTAPFMADAGGANPRGTALLGTAPLVKGGLVVPLAVGGDPLGRVTLGVRLSGLPYGPEDRALVQALCQQLSFTLRTAQLLAQLQEQLEQQERYIQRLMESEDVIARLRQIDRIRREAFSEASHDLRAPLASISYVCQGLLKELFGPLSEDLRQEIGVIHGNARTLGALIDGVLDQAKHDSQKLVLEIAPTSLETVLRSVVPLMEPLAAAADTRLEVDWEAVQAMPVLHADSRRLSQVLLNLISNAVKFTPDGTVRLEAEVRGAQALIRVVDTGAGMPPERLARVFEAFEGGAENALGISGSGLGLSLVKTIADWHGAGLEIQSALGEGTTVTLAWPLGAEEAADRREDLVEVDRLG